MVIGIGLLIVGYYFHQSFLQASAIREKVIAEWKPVPGCYGCPHAPPDPIAYDPLITVITVFGALTAIGGLGLIIFNLRRSAPNVHNA